MAWRGGAGVRITDILPVLAGIAIGVALNLDQSLGDRIVGGLLGAPLVFVVWRWLHRWRGDHQLIKKYSERYRDRH
jgi:hypothetical protein